MTDEIAVGGRHSYDCECWECKEAYPARIAYRKPEPAFTEADMQKAWDEALALLRERVGDAGAKELVRRAAINLIRPLPPEPEDTSGPLL